MWLTSMSIFYLCFVMSMALCGGVVTTLSRTTEADHVARQDTVRSSSAAGILAMIMIAMGCALVLIIGGWFTGGRSGDDDALRNALGEMLVLASVASLSVPLLLPNFILLGLNRGYIGYLCQAVGAVLSAICIMVLIGLEQPLYILMLVSGLLPKLLIWTVCTHVLQRSGLEILRPSFEGLGRSRWMWTQGGHLGVGQMANSAMNPTDLVLIAAFLGTAVNAGYGAVQQILLVPSLFVVAISSSFWPSMTKAHMEGAVIRLKRTYLFGLAVAVLSTLVFVVVVVIFLDKILMLWLRAPVVVPPFVTPGLAAWAVMISGLGVTLTLLRAMGEGRFAARIMVACLLMKIVLSVALLPVFGPAAAPYATVVSAVICIIMPVVRRWPTLFEPVPDQT